MAVILPSVLYLFVIGPSHLLNFEFASGERYIVASVMLNLVCLSTNFEGSLRLPSTDTLLTMFFASTSVLQLTVTTMITFKILRVRLGNDYISVIGVLAESAALYTIANVIYLILLHTRNLAEVWWGQVATGLSVSYSPSY
jgi:ABC-type siderophore export system fused ATPase/permease subunit